MNELHKAYAVLGLEPGSSMESIMRRYKRLIMVWHPDRAPTPEHKEFAEEELKKINNAKDLLAKHLGTGGGHKATGCDCQPEAAKTTGGTRSSSTGSSAGPGPGYHRTKTAEEKYQEEQAAKQRDSERKAREEEEAKAKRTQEEYQKKTTQQSMESAMQQQNALADEKLRGQISVGIIVAFIALEVFGCMAMGAKQWWHDLTWKWQNEHSSSDSGTKSPDIGTNTGTDTSTTPYIPPYDRTPGGNTTTWQQEQDQRDKEKKEREKKQHDDDVYFTKLEIDKQQKIIEHCNSELTNLEIQIADPNVSEYEKNKLRDMRDFRQKNLSDAQAALKIAQDKLASLAGETPVQTAPSTISPFPGNGTGIPFVPIPEHKSFFPSTPSVYSSPFAPAQNSGTVPNNATSKPMFDFNKQGGALDPNRVPDSSQSSLDYFSKLKTIPLTPSTPAPQTQTNSLQSLVDSFKKRRVNQSLQEILKNTGTNTGTSP